MNPRDEHRVEGLWDACLTIEAEARRRLQPKLELFEAAFRDTYEAGVEAPTLSAQSQPVPEVIASALFLKRSLNDLRAVWLLLAQGYTSQAATAAAALFEHGLTAAVLALDPSAEAPRGSVGDIPWQPKELCQRTARLWYPGESEEEIHGYERAWIDKYAAYKWLCKIKHPTVASAEHDAGSTAGASGYYSVMAAPDLRDENLSVKATVAVIALRSAAEAIRQGTGKRRRNQA